MKNRDVAKMLLCEFVPEMKFPSKRSNAAFQPVGSSTCGCYVLHWMEQTCRTYLLNESPCSIGWPSSKEWSARLVKIAQALGTEKVLLEADKEKEELKELKKLEQKAKKEALMKKAKKAETEAATLAVDAAAAFAKVPPTKPCRENLSAEAKAAIEMVEANPMLVCSKCKFSSGCLKCDPVKALAYWLKKEFGHAM